MSALAHVFEAAGLSTIVLASMKEVAERMMPPRTLYCEFPLGRPLGRPDDVELQLDVLNRALALLDSNEPVLETSSAGDRIRGNTYGVLDPAALRCNASARG